MLTGPPRDLFIARPAVVRATLRDLLDDEWTPEIAQARDTLLMDIGAVATAPA